MAFVVAPTSCMTKRIQPRRASPPARVRGMRSLFSKGCTMKNCPGLRPRATMGACTTKLQVSGARSWFSRTR